MLNSDFMEVAVSRMVDREIETQLVLPTVPKSLEGGVPREFIEESPVQIAHRLHSGGEAVQRAMACELLRRLKLDVPTDDALAQQHTVLERQLARDVDAGVHSPVVHVVRVISEDRCLQAEGLEARSRAELALVTLVCTGLS